MFGEIATYSHKFDQYSAFHCDWTQLNTRQHQSKEVEQIVELEYLTYSLGEEYTRPNRHPRFTVSSCSHCLNFTPVVLTIHPLNNFSLAKIAYIPSPANRDHLSFATIPSPDRTTSLL